MNIFSCCHKTTCKYCTSNLQREKTVGVEKKLSIVSRKASVPGKSCQYVFRLDTFPLGQKESDYSIHITINQIKTTCYKHIIMGADRKAITSADRIPSRVAPWSARPKDTKVFVRRHEQFHDINENAEWLMRRVCHCSTLFMYFLTRTTVPSVYRIAPDKAVPASNR